MVTAASPLETCRNLLACDTSVVGADVGWNLTCSQIFLRSWRVRFKFSSLIKTFGVLVRVKIELVNDKAFPTVFQVFLYSEFLSADNARCVVSWSKKLRDVLSQSCF